MSKKDIGMQPMQMKTSTSGGANISSKPIILILSAVILGLLALVVGGGVAVYKVIQTHHMNTDTLAQLKSVESMVQQLKVEQKTLMSALITKEKELEDADFIGDSKTAEKKEEEMEKILDEVIEVEDEIEEEEEVEDEIEDELHNEKKDDPAASKGGNGNRNGQKGNKKKPAKQVKADLTLKVAKKQEAIKKKDQTRKDEFSDLLGAADDETDDKGKKKPKNKKKAQEKPTASLRARS